MVGLHPKCIDFIEIEWGQTVITRNYDCSWGRCLSAQHKHIHFLVLLCFASGLIIRFLTLAIYWRLHALASAPRHALATSVPMANTKASSAAFLMARKSCAKSGLQDSDLMWLASNASFQEAKLGSQSDHHPRHELHVLCYTSRISSHKNCAVTDPKLAAVEAADTSAL